jgi:NADH/NAD ratio-sensing transcriptional regulator Rex
LDNLVFAGSPRLESSKNQKKQSEKFRTQITIMCQVDEENIWIGDSQGRIHIFAISTFQEIFQFETSSINNTKEEEVQDYSDKAHSAEVRSILSFIERQIVVVALPSAVLICRALSTEGVQPLAPPQFLTSIKLRKDTICSMGILPSLGDWFLITL